MTKLIIKTDGVSNLSQGVTSSSIKEAISTFGKGLAAQWEVLTGLAAGVFVQYIRQEQVIKGNKGDVSLLVALADVLADNNNSMFSAFKKAASDIVGVAVYLVQDTETTVKMEADVTKADRAKVAEDFEDKLTKLFADGIKSLHMPKKRASKGEGNKSANSSDTSPSEVTTVSVGTKIAEDSGMMEALSSISTEKQQEALKEVAPLIAQLLEHVANNPNKSLVKDQLTKVVNTLDKSFTLGKVLAKAG